MRPLPALRAARDALAALSFLGVLGAAAFAAPAAAQMVRCESAAGKVTYGNVDCPPGSRPVRTVPDMPPPNAADARAARERAKADQQAVQKIEKQQRAEEAQAAKARAAQAKKDAERGKACAGVSQRVAQLEDRLQRAALNQRAAIEKQLDHARASKAAKCAQ